MTYQHPHDTDDAGKTIADLCAPISARQMPHSALRTRNGDDSQEVAIRAQRNVRPQGVAKGGGWRNIKIRKD
jgi:hypothetical protein